MDIFLHGCILPRSSCATLKRSSNKIDVFFFFFLGGEGVVESVLVDMIMESLHAPRNDDRGAPASVGLRKQLS